MRKVIESTLVSIDGVIGDPPAWATHLQFEVLLAGRESTDPVGFALVAMLGLLGIADL